MGNYRVSPLLLAESATTATTKVIDLNVTDVISRIMIVMKATSAGTELAAHPAANISKVELVDGSTVVTSLSGKEAQALEYYDTGVMPYNYLTDISGDVAMATVNLNFGRKLWDSQLALDPTKFRNLQLKITHNYRTADTAASAATLEAYAFLFDEKKPTPNGYLLAKEHYAYTPGASGTYEYIDLPLDYALRQLMITAPVAAGYPHEVANVVRLSEDNDKRVPLDMHTSVWQKFVNGMNPRIVEYGAFAFNSTPRAIYATPYYDIHVAPMGLVDAKDLIIEKYPLNEPFKVGITTSGNGNALITGLMPHAAFTIPFGDQSDPSDWYEVGRIGSLEARITAGSKGSSGSVQLVTQQMRRY